MNEITTIDRILYDLKPFIEYALDHWILAIITLVYCIFIMVWGISGLYQIIFKPKI
jgi:hypothetical protein